MKRLSLPRPQRFDTRGAFTVLRGWAAVAFLGFGLFQLVGAFQPSQSLTHSDTVFGLQVWAALVALGGGLLLVPRETAPYAAAAVGLAVITSLGASLTAGHGLYETLPFGF